MHLGEVCLMTADAPRLASFYRRPLDLPDLPWPSPSQTSMPSMPA